LESVALTKEHETLLNHDLNTFLRDRDFYERVGLPYRRGYMFHGKPGTGKTSLVNAISAKLNRDVYYMNLRNITSDSMLQSAFSRVPSNQIIVFEDIDAITGAMGPSSLQGPFTLSCLLNCLDGHILNEGIIAIMTSNHPEKLDPALIRAGRIDLSLQLDYADRYQVERMYQLVVSDDDDKQ
ncbi:P-loop containing nucleoside triphosphate hydrolase protein, partial [Syncephalis pseudoplumigaleata]